MRSRILVLFVAAIAGCSFSRSGELYAVASSERGSIVFPNSPANRGELRATLAGGEKCLGRYATIPGPEVTWEDNRLDEIYQEDTQDGMAVLECSRGHVLRCNITRDNFGEGQGYCVDNRGQQMTMNF
jgi:hypothetical protein